jgi:1-acyl-sn-glycerol-3-phosphate acyltransferase
MCTHLKSKKAMQMFSFIFLNRSWATDKKDLTIQLNQLADQTYNPTMPSLNKIGLLIFPEGTLVSPLTRPASKKYAEKCGVVSDSNLLNWVKKSGETMFD